MTFKSSKTEYTRSNLSLKRMFTPPEKYVNFLSMVSSLSIGLDPSNDIGDNASNCFRRFLAIHLRFALSDFIEERDESKSGRIHPICIRWLLILFDLGM